MADNMGERALIWLGQEGYTMEPIKEAGFTALFRAYQPSSPKNKISLSQAAGEDKIVIASGVFLGEGDQAQMAKLPPEKRIQIIRELSKILYSNASAFKMEENQGVLKGITMTWFVFADGFTKDRLMNAVFDSYRTQALVLLHLSDYLGPESGSVQEVSKEHKEASPASPASENIAKDRVQTPPPTRAAAAPPETPLPPPPSAPAASTRAFCANCGKEVQPAAKFCPICGTRRAI